MDVKQAKEIELIARSLLLQNQIKDLQKEATEIDQELFRRGQKFNEAASFDNAMKVPVK